MLSTQEVTAIRLDERTQREIADDYGISQSNVSAIKLRKSHARVDGRSFLTTTKRLTPGEARAIQVDPRPMARIAHDYGVSRTTIRHIKHGRRYAGA